MSPGQMRQLITIEVETVPATLPWGFAQWLNDSGLSDDILKAIDARRREWLAVHSHLAQVCEIPVPATSAQSVAQYILRRGRKPQIVNELGDEFCGKTLRGYAATTATAYRVTGPFDYRRALVCVEAAGGIEKLRLSPVQMLSMADKRVLNRWKNTRVMALSHVFNEKPVFWVMKTVEQGAWNIWEVGLEPEVDLEEGTTVILRNPIF